MKTEQPACSYRLSVKALVLNEAKTGFLITQEAHGWDLPGGGLEHEENPQEALAREIIEEMVLPTKSIATSPSYFVTAKASLSPNYIANVVYETVLEHIQFTKTKECLDIAFLTKENAHEFTLTENAQALLDIFDAKRHQ